MRHRRPPRPGTLPPGHTVELVTDEGAFAELAPQWRRLYGRCAAATPFQSHAWLLSWWRSYGSAGRLRLVLAREGGELVGAAPLTLVRRPVPALVPLGGAISDYGDVLLDDERGPDAVAALAAGLAAVARTALVDLREVRPGAAAERLYAHWHGPRHRLADSLCLELPALPMDSWSPGCPRPRPGSGSAPSCAGWTRSASRAVPCCPTRRRRRCAGSSTCTGCSGGAGR